LRQGVHQQLAKTYEERFAGAERDRQQVWQTLIRYWFQRWIKPSNTVLDLGAGYCNFINNVKAKRKYALDLNPTTPTKAAPDVTVFSQSVVERWPLDSDSVDVIFSSNFFEHLASKSELHHCLDEGHRVLRPGGLLIAMGPNIRFCADVYWDFIDHHLPLSDRSLVEALCLAGFRPDVVIPRFLPYTMVGRKSSLLTVRIYLAMPLVWRFFGKQFLVVGEKP
jgi:SAM-dependent methyltransferase